MEELTTSQLSETGLMCLMTVLDEITGRVVSTDLIRTGEQRHAVVRQAYYMFIDEYFVDKNANLIRAYNKNIGDEKTFLDLYARHYSTFFGLSPGQLIDEYKQVTKCEKTVQRCGVILICPELEDVVCTLQSFVRGSDVVIPPVVQLKDISDKCTTFPNLSVISGSCKRIRGTEGKVLCPIFVPAAEGGQKHRNRIVFPQGKIESGESFIDCAIRETYEETGIKIRKGQLIRTRSVSINKKQQHQQQQQQQLRDIESTEYLTYSKVVDSTPINFYFCILDEEPVIRPISVGEVSHAFRVPIAYMLTNECQSPTTCKTPARSSACSPFPRSSPSKRRDCERSRGASPYSYAPSSFQLSASCSEMSWQSALSEDQLSEISAPSQDNPLTVEGSKKFRSICREIAQYVNMIRDSKGLKEIKQDKTAEMVNIFEADNAARGRRRVNEGERE